MTVEEIIKALDEMPVWVPVDASERETEMLAKAHRLLVDLVIGLLLEDLS